MITTDVRSWLYSASAGMMILGVGTLIRGVSYTPLAWHEAPRVHALEMLFTPGVWATVWIGVGVYCIVASLRDQGIGVGVGLSVALHFFWSLSYLHAMVFADSDRGYVSAISYMMIALLAWWAFSRGQAHEVRIRKEL